MPGGSAKSVGSGGSVALEGLVVAGERFEGFAGADVPAAADLLRRFAGYEGGGLGGGAEGHELLGLGDDERTPAEDSDDVAVRPRPRALRRSG